MNVKKSSPSLYSRIITHLLLIYPILNTYAISGSLSVGKGILLILVGLFLIRIVTKNQRPISAAPKFFVYYCLFWLGSAVFSVLYIGVSVVGALPGIIYSFLFVLLFFYETDFTYLLKWYKYYAIVFLSFFFFQEFMYLSTGIRVPGIIPGVPLTVDSEVGTVRYMEQVIYGNRSSSVFSEPAHFAQWILPLLAAELMFDNSKKRFVYSFALILALLLLRSGNAMIGLAIVLIFFFFHLIFEKRSKMRFVLILVFSSVLLVGGALYVKSDVGADVLDRQDELRVTGNSSDKMEQVRLFRGYYVFADFNFVDQLIGVSDIPTLMNYIKGSEVASLFGDDETYFNAIQSILIKTGYVGLILFFIMCFKLSNKNIYAGKAIVWTLVALSFVAGLFFTTTMALYLVMAKDLKDIKYKNLCIKSIL